MKITMGTFRLRKGWVGVGLVAVLLGAGLGWWNAAAKRPDAVAVLTAGPVVKEIRGSVGFRDGSDGVVVTVDVKGLPSFRAGQPPVGPHGFHIHEGGSCEVGDEANPFLSAGGHWNPDGQPHGNHAGDFPVLFSKKGTARLMFVTDRFSVDDIVGRTVIVHLNPDDYRSQPAGDSGLRIACGVVQRAR